MTQENSAKLAVLIDADNASADIVEPLLEEIAKYGIASVKRIYGDWSSGLTKWRDALLPHAITPIQQFAYTKGKNATDMAMVIDGMDLLYSNTFDGFCIVSSDSDFTRLALRIRENGLTVYGFGQKKTPESFRKACDRFIYTENIQTQNKSFIEVGDNNIPTDTDKKIVTPAGHHDNAIPADNHEAAKDKTITANLRKAPQELKQDTQLLNLLRNAVKEHADDEGWASLAALGQYINKINSDFDSRNYGYSKLSGLIRAIDIFETRSRGTHLWLRIKSRATQPKNANSHPSRTGSAEKQIAACKPDDAVNKKKQVNGPIRPPAQIHETNNNKELEAPHFHSLIPRLQKAIDIIADDQGWIGVGKLFSSVKETDPQFKDKSYNFDSFQAVVAKIYDEWLEKRKMGFGMRVRVNKRYPGTGE